MLLGGISVKFGPMVRLAFILLWLWLDIGLRVTHPWLCLRWKSLGSVAPRMKVSVATLQACQ